MRTKKDSALKSALSISSRSDGLNSVHVRRMPPFHRHSLLEPSDFLTFIILFLSIIFSIHRLTESLDTAFHNLDRQKGCPGESSSKHWQALAF